MQWVYSRPALGDSYMNARWLSFLPGYLRQRLEGRHLLQKILGNSGWLVADKIVRMGVALVVTVWIARYLGPKDFGLLNYALAFVGLFAAFATMGLQGIVIRDLVRRPDEQKTLLASALVLRLIGAFLAIGLASIAIVLFRPDDQVAWSLVIILAMALLPAAVDVIDYRYQAEVNARPIVLIRNGIFILFSLIKIAIILGHGTVLMFAIAHSAETLVVAIAFLFYANRGGALFKLSDATPAECLRLLKESWPLLFAGMSVAVYMRIDQVMLGEMLGDSAVGVFSAAVRISEVWYFVPVSIMVSVGPILTILHQQSTKAYEEKLEKIMRLLAWMSVLAAIGFTLLAVPIVHFLYGEAYQESAKILILHSWAGVFVGFGLASVAWLTNAKLTQYSLYQALAGAIVNIAANAYMIPIYGAVGSALATIIAYAVSGIFFNSFFSKTRPLFYLQMKSIFHI